MVRGLEAPGAHSGRAYEKYATLGLFGHGGVVGVSNATGLREACSAVNRCLKSRFGLAPDIQNMPGHSNHALALGDYTEGRVWIEDDEGDSTAWLADKKGGRESCGVDGWTCTTSPSASMLGAITWWSHTRAACGLSRLMCRKPMPGRRSSIGKR